MLNEQSALFLFSDILNITHVAPKRFYLGSALAQGMFNKILIANRGEIAIRVMRACRELGISTVAVYSEADKNALFAKYADEAVFIGPAPSSQSYLKIDKIIKAALDTGSEAIHPGYGFLSENTSFASACEENGIVFIGPPSSAIDAMGSKITARQTMKDAGVPIVPGIEQGISDPDIAAEIAGAIGYPIILKPAAGGGGIGMKIVQSEKELMPALTSSQSVARSAFGDDTIYIEKLDASPDSEVSFPVLMISGDEIRTGSPVIEGASVTGKVVRHGRGQKIIVYKFKAKKNYRRKQGHRQPFTQVEITAING